MKRLWHPLTDAESGKPPEEAPDSDRLRARLKNAIDRARLMPVTPPEPEARTKVEPLAKPASAPAPQELAAPTVEADALAGVEIAAPEFAVSDEPATPDIAPAAERRSAIRKRTTFSIGKVVVGDEEHFCLIRDISDTGVRIEMRHVPPVGTRVMVEMRTIPPCWATVRWHQGELAGLAFETSRTVDPRAEPEKLKQNWVARSPRFKLQIPVKLKMLHRRIAMETADITLGGLKLKGAHDLTTGTHADVMFGDSLRPITGHICWTTEDSLGFRFETALSRESLMAIMEMGRVRRTAR